MSRTAVPGAAKVHRNGEPKNKERSIEVKKIVKVEIGNNQFPGSTNAKGTYAMTKACCMQHIYCCQLAEYHYRWQQSGCLGGCSVMPSLLCLHGPALCDHLMCADVYLL